jgi:hypothetical protein
VSTEDTITREELAAAFRSGFLYTHSASAAHAAQEVFAHVVRNREPEYEPGAVYQDPAGRAWCRLRTGDGEADWRCCESGTLYSDRYPDRPLRKLVPEPLPEGAQPRPAVSRSEVIDTLGTFGMHEPARIGKIADYIMVLLRGGQ